MGIPISFPLMDFERFFLFVDLLTIWYSGIIFHDLLNDCLEVYQDSRPPAPSTPKGTAVDNWGARGAMAPPLFCKIIIFVFSAKHSFSSSRVWIFYINNWIHRILNDNKVIN